MTNQTIRQSSDTFFTPEWLFERAQTDSVSSHGSLLVSSCQSGQILASRVSDRYQDLLERQGSESGIRVMHGIDFQFSDSETCVDLDFDITGDDVYLFQSLHNPRAQQGVDHYLMAFLIAVRTFREWGANRVTGVLPYLAYSRQEKPTQFKRQPTTAKLIADLCAAAGMDQLITFHSHMDTLPAFYTSIPVYEIPPLAIFGEAFKEFKGREDVILIAPDTGASKYVKRLGRKLDLDVGMAIKFRPEAERAVISQIIGDFHGKSKAIIIDDMIATGGTVHALSRVLIEDKNIPEIHVGVSHNLCLPQAYQRMRDLQNQGILKDFMVTNSIPQSQDYLNLASLKVLDLADIFARLINRIHYNRSAAPLLFDS
jgi:ribose-phosphate pyrophosphokinase